MTRSFLSLLAVSFAGAASLHVQANNPLIAETRGAYNSVKGYLTRAAAAMPEEDYSFKPTPDVRTFGALVGHIADHQMSYCSTARGARKQGDASSKTTKTDLVAALAASSPSAMPRGTASPPPMPPRWWDSGPSWAR